MNYIKYSLFSFLAAMALLSACSEPESPTPIPATSASTATAKVIFVNASPNAPQLNFFVNNVQAGNTLAFPNGQASYNDVQVGAIQLRAKAASGEIGGTLAGNDLLFRAGATNNNNFSATSGRNYTVFVTDTIGRLQPTTPAGTTDPGGVRFLSVEDNLATPATGKAHIRFFHLAPGAPAVWVNVKGNTTALFANRSYRSAATPSGVSPSVSYASFIPVDAATYNLEVRIGSETGTVVLEVTGLTLQEGKIYTIFANGQVGNATTPLGAGIITHN